MRDLRKLDRVMSELGAVLQRKRKHFVYRLPNGETIVRAKTPSDHRAEMNAICRVKRIARRARSSEV